jgi:hypothetical protein
MDLTKNENILVINLTKHEISYSGSHKLYELTKMAVIFNGSYIHDN